MPKWTKEQLQAIEKSATNVIVSAGAGSGKTAVLTERVIHKLKEGIKINELLILTFTNAAAKEMKERIRNKILVDETLHENLEYLETAYITTFDSFSLSLVKKYHYLLNVSSNLSIIDAGLMTLIEEKILNDVMEEFYESDNEQFQKFVTEMTLKNDNNLKKALLNIIASLKLKIAKEAFLDNYLDEYLSDTKIDSYISEFTNIIKNEISAIEIYLENILDSSYFAYGEELERILSPLLMAKTYEEIKSNAFVKLPGRPKNSEEIKEDKENIDNIIKKIKEYLRFSDTEEIKETLKISKDYLNVIIEIIKKFNQRISEYKFNNDLYEFNDIELMAINLLKENKDILEEIKNNILEICIDEYQDTNDLQEEFIKLIQNNNVYMVGDIKQSIYRFRNANPDIFRNKYNDYQNNLGGIKIDLLKNFRSRKEVIKAINLIFSGIMDNDLGGVDYKNTQQMEFGNTSYEEEKEQNQNYNLEILNYKEEGNFTKEEIETFIIAKDIEKKIKENYKVIDKKTNKLRNVKYEDFCIIMDRGVSFLTIKKIFTYLGIPINIYQDRKLTNETDIMVINNILELILKIKDNVFDKNFEYAFISVARSFLYRMPDNDIFTIIKNNNYKETSIYEKGLDISKRLDYVNNVELLYMILEKFDFYEKIITKANINDTLVRIDNLLNISSMLSDTGFTPYEFHDYINKMLESTNEITYKISNGNINTVKLMNIHVSKGLEFPICYYAGLYKEFNKQDIIERFIYDNTYGIITPYFKEGIGTTILKDLLKNKYLMEDISEKIRLFYVALTRAKEKIILVTSFDDKEFFYTDVVDLRIRRKYNSILSMLNSIKCNLQEYICNIDISTLELSKNYLYFNDFNLDNIEKSKDKIEYCSVEVPNEIIQKKQVAKEVIGLLKKEDLKKLEYGTRMHKVFEMADFLNIDKESEYAKNIQNFVNLLDITKETLIYKEHEFIYTKDDIKYHGIIDLLLIDKNVVKIIDYKSKNIDDVKYLEQLKIYYDYVKSYFNKDIKVYLYSIITNKLEEVTEKI